MSETPNLGLDEVPAGASQPHIPINTTFRRLDIVAQLTVVSMTQTAPPVSPPAALGDAYIVPADAVDDWADHVNEVAYFNAGWHYLVPRTGWLAYIIDEGTRFEFLDGSPAAWVLYIPGGGIAGVDLTDNASPPTTVETASILSFIGATVTELAPGHAQIEIPSVDVGVPGGVASLDGGGKVPLSELPSSIIGGVSYQGTWNATTNSPDLGASSPVKGYYYVVATAGGTSLGGITDWKIGDWAIYNGAAWQKVDNTEAVTSVAGRTGTIVLGTTDLVGVATARILGRTTGGSGAAEELTASQVNAMLKTLIDVEYQVAMSDLLTPIAIATGVAYMRAPRAFTLTAVRASLMVASSSGAPVVDINVNGSTILSTKLTIDGSQKTSVTSVAPAVISSPNIADDDEFTFDIDAAGLGAKGLVVTLIGKQA